MQVELGQPLVNRLTVHPIALALRPAIPGADPSSARALRLAAVASAQLVVHAFSANETHEAVSAIPLVVQRDREQLVLSELLDLDVVVLAHVCPSWSMVVCALRAAASCSRSMMRSASRHFASSLSSSSSSCDGCRAVRVGSGVNDSHGACPLCLAGCALADELTYCPPAFVPGGSSSDVRALSLPPAPPRAASCADTPLDDP